MPAPNSTGPPLDVDAVISTTMEAILYGFSVLMFALTVWALLRQKQGGFNVAMLVVACLLFLFSTIHMCIDIYRLFSGFVRLRGGDQLIAFFGDISSVTFVAKNSIYSFQTVLGDSVVIYRAYVVWQSVYPIILPSLLLVAVAATAVGSVYSASVATPGSSLSVFEQSGMWITAFFSSTLACNLLGTLALAYRLWTVDRRLRHVRSRQPSFLPVVLVCVDSGILYSIFLMHALILLVRGSRAQFIILDMISPIISISFYAIILRVAFIKARRERGTRGVNIIPQLGTRRGPETALPNTNFAPRSQIDSRSHSVPGIQSIASSPTAALECHVYPPGSSLDSQTAKTHKTDNGGSKESLVESHLTNWHAA